MVKPKIYLETTIFNFVFADDAKDKKEDTLKLFEEIKAGKYIPFTSRYSIKELEDDTTEKRDKMLQLLVDYNIEILPDHPEVAPLAKAYLDAGIIPQKYATDAYQIAFATVMGLDAIVSWNFKHIVKMKTIRLTESINIREGYNRRILINTPTEVIEND